MNENEPFSLFSHDTHIVELPNDFNNLIFFKEINDVKYIFHDGMTYGLKLSDAINPNIYVDVDDPIEWFQCINDPQKRKCELSANGVCGEVIFPTLGLIAYHHVDLQYIEKYSKRYNKYVREYKDWAKISGMVSGRCNSLEAELTSLADQGFDVILSPQLVEGDPLKYFSILLDFSHNANIPVAFHAFSERQSYITNKYIAEIAKHKSLLELLPFLWLNRCAKEKTKVLLHEYDVTYIEFILTQMLSGVRTTSEEESIYTFICNNLFVGCDYSEINSDLKYPLNLLWCNDFPHPSSSFPNLDTSAFANKNFLKMLDQSNYFANKYYK